MTEEGKQDQQQNQDPLAKFRAEDGSLKADDLGKSYINLEKSLGSRIAVPKDDAPPEEWEKFYTSVGRPAKVEEYGKYTPPEGLPWDADAEGRFYSQAHKHGLTKKQAAALLEWYSSETQQGIGNYTREAAARKEKAWADLKGKWGAAVEGKVALAQAAVAKNPALIEALNETGLGDHPAFLEFAAAYGALLQEDGELETTVGTVGKEEALKEINTLQSEKGYTDRDHPDHKRIIARIKELLPVAYA